MLPNSAETGMWNCVMHWWTEEKQARRDLHVTVDLLVTVTRCSSGEPLTPEIQTVVSDAYASSFRFNRCIQPAKFTVVAAASTKRAVRKIWAPLGSPCWLPALVVGWVRDGAVSGTGGQRADIYIDIYIYYIKAHIHTHTQTFCSCVPSPL